jgi:hypothetical protein
MTRGEELKSKLIALCREYGAEIEAKDHWTGYSECGQDVRMTLTIDGVYMDGDVVHPYEGIDLGNRIA